MPTIDDGRIIQLRRRSQHYRRLALGPMDWKIAQQLDSIADECDTEAEALLVQRWRAVS